MLKLITDELFREKFDNIIALLSLISDSKVNNLADSLVITENNNDYSYTFSLKAKNGRVLSQHTINLPIESSVVHLTVADDGENLIFTLRNGETTSVPVGAIIRGLATSAELEAEKQARATGDKETKQLIESEVTARENAIRETNSKVDNEKTARELDIKKLENAINALPFFIGEDGYVYGRLKD